jgi:monoamine oxidase
VSRRPRARRVVVLGGGAAGLAAAAVLCRRGMAVTVVEARDRLGGRIDTREDPVLGIAVEHGAEFVHGRPARELALARRAGVRVRRVPDGHLRRAGARLEDAGDAFEEAQALLARGARDGEPIEATLRKAASGRDRRAAAMARALVRGFYLADPRTASSRALARMTGALEALHADVSSRVVEGYARLLDPLVRTIRRGRGELRLGTLVEEVRWRPGAVEVRARGAGGGRLPPLRADRAIVTLPLAILRDGAVRFSPGLREKRRAAAALAMGPIVKVLLRFRRPPWRDARRTRELVFLHVEGAPVPVLWTLAPVEAPLLVGWAGGPDAVPLAGRPAGEIVAQALRSAARGLGRTPGELEDALDGAAVADWTAVPLARGGYAVFPVGSAGAAAALASSVEATLFFAGEATAGGMAGTVEGALRSGERAAREVLETFTGGRR